MTKTKLMGILNVTPDSFYANSRFPVHEQAIQRGLEIYEEGADIIDIGGESTRPGSDSVSSNEEIKRVIPVILALSKKIPIPISIDTMKPDVAREAVKAGATMINDVSGFSNVKMRQLAAESGLPICVMHMQGMPKTMQHNPHYPEGIMTHLENYFSEQIQSLLAAGVSKEQIILDPGIGFGKTVADNLEILHNLCRLKDIGYPLLLGTSRKSFLSKIINKPADDLLAATLAVNMLNIMDGVEYIRVHDVREHRDVMKILEQR